MKFKLLIGIISGLAILTIGCVVLNMNYLQNTLKSNKILPIPVLLEDKNPDTNLSDYYIKAQEGKTNFIGNKQTSTLGYNGSYLGPVIKVRRGEEVRMHVTNELNDSTSVHWNGLELEGPANGGLVKSFLQGQNGNPISL